MQSLTNSVSTKLVELFETCGYVRLQNSERLAKDGHRVYKKGAEVRLVFETPSDVRRAERLLEAVDLKFGKAFQKHSRWVLPLYSVETVKWFIDKMRARGTPIEKGFAVDGRRVWHRTPRETATHQDREGF